MAAVLIVEVFSTKDPISLSLVEYRRWPDGAMVRLSNNTGTTIHYLSERNETPRGNPVLCLEKTPGGWTNVSPTVLQGTMMFQGANQPPKPAHFEATGPSVPISGARLDLLLEDALGPGKSVEFFVRLEPGTSPKKIGAICILPQSALAAKLQPWRARIQRWLGMKVSLPGEKDVWCPTPLYPPSKQPDAHVNQ